MTVFKYPICNKNFHSPNFSHTNYSEAKGFVENLWRF